jgi:hypothetical protein
LNSSFWKEAPTEISEFTEKAISKKDVRLLGKDVPLKFLCLLIALALATALPLILS